jgi:hypothetical protein
MSTAILAPEPVAGPDTKDEVFDLDLRIVTSVSVPFSGGGSPARGFTDTDNCVMTDKCTNSRLCD